MFSRKHWLRIDGPDKLRKPWFEGKELQVPPHITLIAIGILLSVLSCSWPGCMTSGKESNFYGLVSLSTEWRNCMRPSLMIWWFGVNWYITQKKKAFPVKTAWYRFIWTLKTFYISQLGCFLFRHLRGIGWQWLSQKTAYHEHLLRLCTFHWFVNSLREAEDSLGVEPKWTRKSKKDGTGKDVKRNPFFWELASEWKQLAIGNFPQSYPSSRMTYY